MRHSTSFATFLAMLALVLAASNTALADLMLNGGGLAIVEEGGTGEVDTIGSGNLADPATGALPFGTESYPSSKHTIPHINDLLFGNEYSWIAYNPSPTLGKGFAGISFAAAQEINSIAFGRDSKLQYTDRHLGQYTLQYTTVPNPDVDTPDANWTDIGTLNYGTAGGSFYSQPSIRHRYSFDAVTATGIRLIVPGYETSGNQAGTCIEEFEIYGPVPEPGAASMLLAILLSAAFRWKRDA